jgi:hypothetical protein
VGRKVEAGAGGVTKYDGGTGLLVPVNQEPAISRMSCGQKVS